MLEVLLAICWQLGPWHGLGQLEALLHVYFAEIELIGCREGVSEAQGGKGGEGDPKRSQNTELRIQWVATRVKSELTVRHGVVGGHGMWKACLCVGWACSGLTSAFCGVSVCVLCAFHQLQPSFKLDPLPMIWKILGD